MKLRDKFLLVLVGIPTVAVTILLIVTTQVFVADKMNFIFESQLQNAHMMATHILSRSQGKTVNWKEIQNLSIFNDNSYTKIFLFNTSGSILVSSEKSAKSLAKIEDYVSMEILNKISDLSINEGSFEDNATKKSSSMVSFIRLNELNAILLVQTPKSSAFRASSVFILKGLLTIIALILSSAFASIILSKSMTKNLTQLEASMNAFGKGALNSQVPIKGRDEISNLGKHFNRMVTQINSLMIEQKEKMQLEYEMDMAGKLQESFFPNRHFKSEHIEFAGYYQASQKCSGDWWFYFTHGDNFIAFMGDVTGHGIKSALMTSASRSMFAYLEKDFTDTAKAMSMLNYGFFAAANGELNMSACLFKFNLKTGELEYTNASHDPALLFSPDDKQIQFLDQSHGKRLGSNPNENYKKTVLKLSPKQILFCYTDGLLELKNQKGKAFSDKNLLKIVTQINLTEAVSLTYSQNEFQSQLHYFSDGPIELKDDLSYFFIRYNNRLLTTQKAQENYAS